MATLFLVRHGQASFGAHDYDLLSEIGHRQSRLLGEYLADRGVRPVRVMTGSLRRQRQTWEGMAEGLASRGIACPDAVIRPGLDEYEAERLLAALVATGQPRAVSGDGRISAGHVGVPGDPADPEVRRAHFRLLRQVLTEWAHGRLTVADHRTWEAFRDGAVAAMLEAWRGPTSAAAAAPAPAGAPPSPAAPSAAASVAGTAPASDAGTASAAAPAAPALAPAARATSDRDEDIVVVSSGGPIASILVGLLAMPPAGFVGLNLMARNTGYTEFKGNGRQPNLSSFNGIAHLDTVERRELITYA